MKIKLQSNTSLIKSFLNEDISFGYQYGYLNHEFKNEKNSFLFKVFSFLENKIFHTDLNDEKIDFAKSVAKTTKDYEEIIGDEYYTYNLKVQINFPTKFHEFFTKDFYLNMFSKEYHESFKSNSDLSAAEIVSTENVVLLGSNAFFTDGFCTDLKNHIGIKRASSLVLLHEIAHGLDVKLNSFTPKLKIDGDTEYNRFFEQMSATKKEIYADVGAILLQRNIDLKNGTYDQEQTLSDLNSLMFHRNKSLPPLDTQNSKSFLHYLTHFTTPGLTHLKQKMNDYGDSPLSLEQINSIAKECCDVGLAKIMVVTASTEKFSNIFKDFKDVDSLVEDFGIGEHIDFEWLKKHKSIADKIHSEKDNIKNIELPYPLEQSIWNYEFNKIEFNRFNQNLKAKENIDLSCFEISNKNSILDKIESLRKSSLKVNKENYSI